MRTKNFISGNATVLRNINRSIILNVIRSEQPVSRSKIAEITGLNKSTVSSIVLDLLNEDLIFEKGNGEQNIGRKPINLFLKSGMNLIGAFSVDAADTHLAIFDIDGEILNTSSIKTEPADGKTFIENCLLEIQRLMSYLKINRLKGLGISIAGIVDPNQLIINYAPNLGWEEFNIGRVIRDFWPDLEILTIGNDAKCSAQAELWFGQYATKFSNFVFLEIGPGIGSGIVVENKVLDGEFHASGEVGHMIIFEGGEPCTCGNRGCWEKYASDRATTNRYIAKKYGEDKLKNITIDEVIDLAVNGDEAAKEVLIQTGFHLGLGISNILKTIDPHAFIIGGGIIRAWDLIYPEINRIVIERAFHGEKKNILILPTSLKISPKLLGAASYAIKKIFDDYKIMK
jgi:predicted NBD/HSP70 family sugar kinase